MHRKIVNKYKAYFMIVSVVMLFTMSACANSQAPAKTVENNSFDVNAFKESIMNDFKVDETGENHLAKGKISVDSATMELSVKTIGNPDENGYPLYIALHGGGVEDAQLSKEQYEMMANNYYGTTIENGVYIATHGIVPRYDEHYRPESFEFYDMIIEEAIKYYNVDPNRVYLMGFSSGGDGVYAIAPAIADRFAAVNMSAGFPHIQALENMCNLPICLQVGEKDDAYDRCYVVAQYDGWLNDYAKQFGFGFPHDTYIHINGTHNTKWSDLDKGAQKVVAKESISDWEKGKKYETTIAITDTVSWLNQHTRNPYPEHVVWNTNVYAYKRKTNSFYWLGRNDNLEHATIEASYDKNANTVTIDTQVWDDGILNVYLNNDMVDLNKDVKFIINSKKYTVKPVVSEYVMEKTLKERGDFNYIFDAEVEVIFESDNGVSLNVISSEEDVTKQNMKSPVRFTKDGLLVISHTVLGASFDDIKKMMPDAKFGPYEKWDYGQYNDMMWTYTEDDNNSAVFFFHKNQCIEVRAEKEGKIDTRVSDAAKEYFTARFEHDGLPTTEGRYFSGIYCEGGAAYYYITDNVYDGKSHMSQGYTYTKIY